MDVFGEREPPFCLPHSLCSCSFSSEIVLLVDLSLSLSGLLFLMNRQNSTSAYLHYTVKHVRSGLKMRTVLPGISTYKKNLGSLVNVRLGS